LPNLLNKNTLEKANLIKMLKRKMSFTQIKNDILKCDQCNELFDSYCEPKLLVCNNTICTKCEINIIQGAKDAYFDCVVCFKKHFIPSIGFPVNKIALRLLNSAIISTCIERDELTLKYNLRAFPKSKNEGTRAHRMQNKQSKQFE